MDSGSQDSLKILIFPSWTNSPEYPQEAGFFMEQAHALAALRPQWRIGYAGCDMTLARLPSSFSRMMKTARRILRRGTGCTVSRPMPNLTVYYDFMPYFATKKNRKKRELTHYLARLERCLLDFIKTEGKPDILHAHVALPAGYAAAILGEKYGIKTVLTEHMCPFPLPEMCDDSGKPLAELAETFRRIDASLSVSAPHAKAIADVCAVPAPRVMPNIVNTDVFRPLPNPQKETSVFTFLFAGMPSERKGLGSLIRVLAGLPEHVRLLLAGANDDLAHYLETARQLGCADRIRCLGTVPNHAMPEVYAQCDCFVLPSRHESFGVVYIEALACGKPVIATRCGAPESFLNADCGLLIPSDDDAALKSAMLKMMTDCSGYPAETLRKFVLDRFSPPVIVAQLEAIYRGLLTPDDA